MGRFVGLALCLLFGCLHMVGCNSGGSTGDRADLSMTMPSEFDGGDEKDGAVGGADGGSGDGSMGAVDGGVGASDGGVGASDGGVEAQPNGWCSADHWCWQSPLPHGNYLAGVWAATKTLAWAGGSNGTLQQWDGTTWSKIDIHTKKTLVAIRGSAPDDVWLTAQDVFYHWDGLSWSPVTWTAPRGMSLILGAVWPISKDDAWSSASVVENDGTSTYYALHWDGTAWRSALADANHGWATWASGPRDAWCAKDVGSMLHWDGTAWHPMSSGTTNTLTAVWGAGPSDVWAVGSGGTLVHWNGVVWSPQSSGTTANLYAIWGSGGRDVWAVGGPGDRGVVIHFDGTSWSTVNVGTEGRFTAISGTAPNDAWIVGVGGTVMHWQGTRWTKVGGIVPAGMSNNTNLNDIWGADAHDVWAVGTGGVTLHFDGTRWSAPVSGSSKDLNAVWGTATNHVWTVGSEGTALRWDGTAWTSVPVGTTNDLTGVHGLAQNEVWAAGKTLHRWNGTAWFQVSNGGLGTASDVRVLAPNQVWAVGETVRWWNGMSWTLVPGLNGIPKVWGTGPGDLWIGPPMYQWNGSTFLSRGSAGIDVCFTGADRWWSVNHSGVIFGDNTGDSGTVNGLWGIWRDVSTRNTWVVGDGGTVLFRDGQTIP